MKIAELYLILTVFLMASASFMLYFVKRFISIILLSFIYNFVLSFLMFSLGFVNVALVNLMLSCLIINAFMIKALKPSKKK
ncbi:MAG: hypothetical protein AB7T10_05795 [bacterium]